jgi:hypothetical protein
MKCIARVSAVRRRIREQRDQRVKAIERVRVAMREHDRQRIVAASALVDEVHRGAIDRGGVVARSQ